MRISRSVSTPLHSSLSLLLSYTLSISLCAPFAIRKVEAASPAKKAISPRVKAQAATQTGDNTTQQDVGIGADPARRIDRGSSERFRVTPPAPKQGTPLPDLPNLDEVRTRRHLPSRARTPVPATLCSPHDRDCQHRQGRTLDPPANTGTIDATPIEQPSQPIALVAAKTDFPAVENLLNSNISPLSDSPFSYKLPGALFSPALQGGGASNLALGKAATQWDTLYGSIAARAVDGNTSNATHTDLHNQVWWQVDLGNVQSIQTIKVYNRTDCCFDRLSNFYVFVSDQPFTSTDLNTTLGQAGVSSYYTAGQGGYPTSITVNRTGRYVRVQLSGANYLSLAEVEVWGIPVPNLALGKAATQWDTLYGSVASRAVDGNTSNATHTDLHNQVWWQVDMGDVQPIQTINIWNRTDCCFDRLSNFYVFVSNQPFDSTNLNDTLNQAGVSNYYTAGQGEYPTSINVNRTGRYVRVQLSGENYLSLAEVEVWKSADGSQPPPATNFSTARIDPVNRTGMGGEDLLSGNYNWSLPLVNLPGRAGLDLGLSLSYNSLVWTRSGSSITFDADRGFPAPGFRLGFPTVQPRFFNPQTSTYSYLLITSSGARVELRQVGTTNVYEAADSSYLRLVDYGEVALGQRILLLYTSDGTKLALRQYGTDYQCFQIEDTNGNIISISYDDGSIYQIKDTLGRDLTFIYHTDPLTGARSLVKITALRLLPGQTHPQEHDLVTFGYTNVQIQTSFSGLSITGPVQNSQTIPVLWFVGFNDGNTYTFTTTSWGQVSRISRYVQDNANPTNWVLVSYLNYNLPTGTGNAQSDCPRYTEKRVWALGWNYDQNGVVHEVVTSFSPFLFESGERQMTAPDGTVYKEMFATTGWQRGLTYQSEVWSVDGVKQKWTTVDWTQDNTSVAYQLNPRPHETHVYDAQGNHRRTRVEYTSYGLPSDIYEYDSDATTVLRGTHIDYNLDEVYTSRRILGLVSMQRVFDRGAPSSKVDYLYDEWGNGEYLQGQGEPVQRTPGYYLNFLTGRGNVTSIRRWDVTDPENSSKAAVMRMGYNTNGSMIFSRDPQGHQSTISYGDSFSNEASHPMTLAYPTRVTDADSYSSTIQYDYYLGAVSKTVDPKGATVLSTYDAAGRTDRVSNTFNNAFKQFHYGLLYEVTYTSVKDLSTPVYAITKFDGLGRPYASAQDAPVAGVTESRYSGQYVVYDVMGRVWYHSRPTEMGPGWVTTGDDASGWMASQQTYDWKGRPRVRINVDGTTSEAVYGGCGCAGGEVTTVRDERGRRRRFSGDVLGRLAKVEELNWDASLYSTTTYAYNARDQITVIDQAGQVRSFEYDGHGRVSARTTPEQGRTTFSYYADDQTQTVVDARGATSTFGYNGRHLVTSISYGVPAGVTATPNVSISYDEAGNRTLMTDGLGYAEYQYNTLSRMMLERRYFSELNALHTTEYGYDLAGGLTRIQTPWGEQVSYGRDHVGRVTGVSGQAGSVQYASNLQYRAFGSLKQMAYGNGRSLSLSYDTRMRMTQWDVSGVMGWEYRYDTPLIHENTGRVAYARNLYDATLDRSYDYDHVGRLWASHTGTEARGHTGVDSWGTPDGPYSFNQAYDVYGNVLQRNGWGGWNFAYQSATFANNRMQMNPQNGAAMLYDASGNLTSDGQESYSYDATGQQSYASGTNLYQYYDGDGLRAKKVEGGVASYYVRSSMLGNQVQGEISNGVWKRSYVYLGMEKLIIKESGQTRFVHADPVTKSQRVTDTSGTVLSIIDIDPFGGETNRSNNAAVVSQRFTTYERDGNGGDDAQARRFEGQWTRFSQPDPSGQSYNVGDPQSFNRYSYAGHDPVNRVDPSGLIPWETPMRQWYDLPLRLFIIPLRPLPLDPPGMPPDPPVKVDVGEPPPPPCNVALPTDRNQRALVNTIMHENTSPGLMGQRSYTNGDTLGNPAGDYLDQQNLLGEARYIAAAIVNESIAEGRSVYETVMNDRYINDGTNFAQFYYNYGEQLVNRAMQAGEGSAECEALKRAVTAATTRDERYNLPLNIRHWRGRVQVVGRGRNRRAILSDAPPGAPTAGNSYFIP